MKLPLKIDRSGDHWSKPVHITESLPFAYSQRGVLCHRPKHAKLHYLNPTNPHLSISYWCNGGVAGKSSQFSEDTEGRLVCLECEINAIKSGLPSSSEILGEHVCTGKLKAVRKCQCSDSDEG